MFGAFVAWKVINQGRIDFGSHLNVVAIFALAAGSLALTLLGLLPRAPFVNLTVDFDGVRHRRFLRLQNHTWTELSDFSVGPRRWWPRYRPPMVIAHFGYQMSSAEKGDTPDIAIEIDPRRYGDADDLCMWLNDIRHLALMQQLQPHRPVTVPAGFRGRALSLAPRDRAPNPAETSYSRRKHRPPPTVERL
jgi:hypothetical protein